ncbi:MAG: glycosyltransferase, partial [Acidiferrobacterales bacterium]|nr:glycosyltransferase [Acidiferrobacterales bacterium]
MEQDRVKETISDKKVALFLPNLDGGGAERTMLSLAKGIAERGYDVDLVLAQAEGPYLKMVPDTVRLVDLGEGVLAKRLKTIKRLPALFRYLRREKPGVLLSALTEANVVALCAKTLARCPERVIVVEQNTLSQKVTKHSTGLLKWYPAFARFTYGRAYRVVGVSEGVVADLVDNIGISGKNTMVINNPGITPQTRENASQPLEHPWFQPGEPPVILSVGRLHVQKDYETLLRAFHQVRKQREARLLILGDGELRDSLENLCSSLGISDDVGLPGFVDNPQAFMAHAAVYALSSRWEGLPTVLVEALYCGPPLVATDCPSGPREILQGGKLGCLVPVQDPDALAEGIISALDGQTPVAPKDSWRTYDLETIVSQYVSLLFDS